MIPPDGHVCDRANAYTGLVRELRTGTVFIQSRRGSTRDQRQDFRRARSCDREKRRGSCARARSGNPCNTNRLIAMNNTKGIPRERWYAPGGFLKRVGG